MYGRRRSPYSRIEEVRRSRAELVQLVVMSVVAGTLLNVLASGVYDQLLYWVPSPLGQAVLFVLGLLAVVLAVGFIAFRFFGRLRSQGVETDVAVPYHFPEDKGAAYLTVARQHPFRPHYEVAWLARSVFTQHFPLGSAEAQVLAAKWQDMKREGTPIQHHLARMHGELVDALIVYALRRYGENALGPEARFGWWHVSLSSESYSLEDLPDVLGNNPFLRNALGDRTGWKLLLPEGMEWEITGTDSGHTMALKKPGWGHVVIRRMPEIWVSTRKGQPGKVLSQGLGHDDESDFYVLGSRVELRADFERTFLPNRDNFHQWATGLLAQVEEALDWGFFLHSRADRIIWDVPWKIGDLPGPETSIWDKLVKIEKQLEGKS